MSQSKHEMAHAWRFQGGGVTAGRTGNFGYTALACAAVAVLAAAGIAISPTASATPPAAPQNYAQDFAIPAGKLSDVLTQSAAVAGVPLSFDPKILENLTSPGLHGRYPPQEGLERLLNGSGYALVAVDDGYSIRLISPAGARSLPEPHQFETILVTARKPRLFETPDVNAGALGMRDTKDVPFSIGSFTSDTVEALRARTTLDVLRNDPSVTPVTFGASYDGVAVRGFSANTFNNVRRDGLLANVYSDVPLENKERIDVLKGVSGFLYGIGDPSGLVNYVIKRPTRNRLLSLTAEIRSYDGFYTNVDAGGPMAGDRFGYRINAAREKVGNFSHPGDLDRTFVSGAVDARLTDQALLQLDFDYQEKSQAASASLGQRSDGTLVPASSIDPRQLIGQPWEKYKSRSWNLGGRLEYAFSDAWSLTSQLGYGSTFRNALFNNVNSVSLNGDVLNGGISYEGEDYRVTSGQIFVTGKFDEGSIRNEVVTGYSYSKMVYPEGPYTRLPDVIGNIYDPMAALNPALPNDTNLPSAHSTQNSIFFSNTLEVGEHWSILAGARYIDYINDKPKDYPDSGVRLRYTASSVIPAASVALKPTPNTTIYGSYTRGFEQGAYAPSWADNAYERLDPITSRQYEVGVKSTAIESLILTGAYFDIDKPLQAVSNIDNRFKTQGRQRHRGIELTVNGQLTQQLNGIIGISWLDAKQSQTGDSTVDGKRPANVPKFQASIYLDYRLLVAPGLSLNGGYYHLGNRPLTGANTIIVPAYNRWDAGAAYSFLLKNKPTILRLTVHNITGKRYWESVVYGAVGMAQPRTVALSWTTQL